MSQIAFKCAPYLNDMKITKGDHVIVLIVVSSFANQHFETVAYLNA